VSRFDGRLAVLFVTAFVDMVGLTMIVPLLPYYATDFGATAVVVGFLISAFSVAQLLSAPIWGRLSDRRGRRPAIIAGLVITAVAYVLFGIAASVWVLLLSRVVQGLGGGTIGVVQAYVADASPPESRTKSLGWLTAVTSLGAVAGPAFGSALVAIGGRTAPGFGAAAISALVAVFAWRYLKETAALRASGTSPQRGRVTGRAAIRRVVTHWREPASRLIWIYTIAIGAFYGTIQTVPLLLMDRLGITEQTVGYFIMYLGGMGVIVRSVLLGYAVDHLGEPQVSRLGIASLAAGLAATGLAGGGMLLLLGFTLMPLGTGLLFPCVTGQLSRVVPGLDRGLYMGVQHTFGGVSRVGFPIAAGFMMDNLGLGVPFWVSGVLVLVLLPLTSAMRIPRSAPSRPLPATDIAGELPIETAE